MKIIDIDKTEKRFIIKIAKDVCENKNLNVRRIGGNYIPNHNCEWWQELSKHHEIIVNKYWAKGLIRDFNLTDDDIELYFPKKVKIKVEIGKCNCCGKGKKKYIQDEVDRICPHTKRARKYFERNGQTTYSWINSCDYILIN